MKTSKKINHMNDITTDIHAIAACGLYCGACRKYRNGKCPGCHKNEKASWCKIRRCCIERGYHTCAECDKDITTCPLHNTFISKVFALIFRSDRPACISYIRQHGEQAYAEEMTRRGQQTMKRQ